MMINGYNVTTAKTDSDALLVSVAYIRPCGRMDAPEWEKTAFVCEKTKRFADYQETIVNYIAQLQIPGGGYVKIEI